MNFNPQQQHSLLSKMGYQGPADPKMMEAFLSSNPGAAAKMGKFSRAAQKMMTPNQQTTGMAVGGFLVDYGQDLYDAIQKGEEETEPKLPTQEEIDAVTNPPTYTGELLDTGAAKTTAATALDALNKAKTAAASDPESAELAAGVQAAQKAYDEAQGKLTTALAQQATQMPTGGELAGKVFSDPTSLIEQAKVDKIEETPEQIISQDTGKVSEETPTVTSEQIQAQEAATPEAVDTTKMEAAKVSDEMAQVLEDTEAAKAKVSAEGTVRGQLDLLMDDFEEGTPPWASGAMREAMSIMQKRGLGASSIAGQAITQAAMESALAIATQDAATVAQFEMQNLNNEQQTTIFKSQQRIAGLLSDQAAENAAQQFNAASDNQTKQFMAELESSTAKFNAAQVNAIRESNAGRADAAKQFNATMQTMRDQFNAQNSLVIAQANAQWRQNIATIDSAAQNEANMQLAKDSNALTAKALDDLWQRERDIMAFAFTSAESALDRDLQMAVAEIQAGLEREALAAEESAAKASSIISGVTLAAKIFDWI